MSIINYESYVKCGKVFQPDLPDGLNPTEPSIVLGEVTVNTKHIPRPRVFIKFSEFIAITILGLNPKIKIMYRLVRIDKCSEDAQILQEWKFEFTSSNVIEIANVDTNQPTVLNFCDDLDPYVSHNLIYKLEIIQLETNHVRDYQINNKSIIATVLSQERFCYEQSYRKIYRNDKYAIFFAECGRVYNPVLPLHLNKKEKPVKLTQVSFDIRETYKACILINFSGFVTSVLREERFDDLTFRLVKTVDHANEVILKEWPFRRAFVNDTNIIEPVVYNFCECIDARGDKNYTYTIELVEVKLSEESYYIISQKSMTAQIYCKTDQQSFYGKEC